MTQEGVCSHFELAQEFPPSSEGCGACLAVGDTWVHLRRCLICGRVGCCNDSKNRHATAHFRETAHPVMRSIEPDEEWMWCFVDEIGVNPAAEE